MIDIMTNIGIVIMIWSLWNFLGLIALTVLVNKGQNDLELIHSVVCVVAGPISIILLPVLLNRKK